MKRQQQVESADGMEKTSMEKCNRKMRELRKTVYCGFGV